MTKVTGPLLLSASLLAAAAGCGGGGGPAPSADKALTAFAILSPPAVGVIDEASRTVRVAVPEGTAVTALVATFGSSGVRVSVGPAAQASGVTANDFTSPVDYTVTAADGSAATYRVTVTVCGPNTTAGAGACDCAAGFGDCDGLASTGCELPLSSDPANCGACGHACSSGVCAGGACQAPTCGDGVVQPPESCDPGTGWFTATCNVNCTTSACGDGIVNPAAGEQCDAGGTADTAICLMASGAGSFRCQVSRCGDGYLNPAAGEQCDTGGVADTATCNARFCTNALCGDGYVNAAAGEQCDTGGTADTAECLMASGAGSLRCQVSRCGDGYLNPAAGEQCDSGGVDTATCNGRICTNARCGDGYVNAAAGEQCDTGGTADTAECLMASGAGSLRCQVSRCGDGYLNAAAGEQCDSGGVDTATCNGRICTNAACGDGYVNVAAGEQCDFGTSLNGKPGGCCTASCTLLANFTTCP